MLSKMDPAFSPWIITSIVQPFLALRLRPSHWLTLMKAQRLTRLNTSSKNFEYGSNAISYSFSTNRRVSL